MSGVTPHQYESLRLEYLIPELYIHINIVENDPDMHVWTKLRTIVHTGIHILSARINLIIMSGLAHSSSTEHIDEHVKTLTRLIAIPMQDILTKFEYYYDFARIAYSLQEIDIFAASIRNGARLNYNSYFMTIHKQYENKPEFIGIFDMLGILLADSQPLPWETTPALPATLSTINSQEQISLQEQEQSQTHMIRQAIERADAKIIQAQISFHEYQIQVAHAETQAALQAQRTAYEAEISRTKIHAARLQKQLISVQSKAFHFGRVQGHQEAGILKSSKISSPRHIGDQLNFVQNLSSRNTTQQYVSPNSEQDLKTVVIAKSSVETPEVIVQENARPEAHTTMLPEVPTVQLPAVATTILYESEALLSAMPTEKLESSNITQNIEVTRTQDQAIDYAINQFNYSAYNEFMQQTATREKAFKMFAIIMNYECKKTDATKLAMFIKNIEITINECVSLLCNKSIIKICKRAILEKLITFPANQLFTLNNTHNLLCVAGEILDKSKPEDVKFKSKLKELLKKCDDEFKVNSEIKDNKPDVILIKKQDKLPISPKADKQPKIKVLSPIEALKKAMDELDHTTINTLILKHESPAAIILEPLYKLLCDKHHELKDEFLNALTLPKSFFTNKLPDTKLPFNIFMAFIKAAINLEDKDYFIVDITYNLEELLLRHLKDDANKNKLIGHDLIEKLNNKHAKCHASAEDELAHITKQLEDIQPNSNFDIRTIEYAANIKDRNNNSILHLAMSKQVNSETIIKLIDNSIFTILAINKNNETILHSWAKNTKKYQDIMLRLLDKFSTKVSEFDYDPMYSAIQSFATGDTFIHVLLKNNIISEKFFIKLFSTGSAFSFAPALLIRNNDGKTPLDLLSESKEYHEELENLFMTKLNVITLPIISQNPAYITKFFPADRPFFGTNTDANIIRLLEAKKYSRILKLNLAHNKMRADLKKLAVSMPSDISKGALEKYKKNVILIIEYFGSCELQRIYNGKTLIEQINIHISEANDPKLEAYLNQQYYILAESHIPINASFAWLRICQHLDATNPVKLTIEMFDNHTETLKPRVDTINPSNLRSALDYAIIDSNLEMIKFLVTRCKATITPKTFACSICNSFSYIDNTLRTEPNTEIAEFLYTKFFIKMNPSLRKEFSVGMYNYSLSKPTIRPLMLKWLINNDFPVPDFYPKNRNVAQFLLVEANNDNAEKVIDALLAILTKFGNPKSLLENEDVHGKCSAHHVIALAINKVLSADNVYRFFNIFFDFKADMRKVTIEDNNTLLHFALSLNSEKLIRLFFERCSEEHVKEMMQTKEFNTNLNPMEFSEILVNDDECLKEIYEIVKSKHISLFGPTTASRLAWW